MIVYNLGCSNDHRFEGWFASGDAFDEQQRKNLVRCPMCDEQHVERLPSARVRVPKGEAPVDAPKPPDAQAAVAGMPADLLAKLREVVRKTEDVGERFPEEARKIHYNESPQRAIRGRATKEDAEALKDEGIEFQTLPPYLTGDSH